MSFLVKWTRSSRDLIHSNFLRDFGSNKDWTSWGNLEVKSWTLTLRSFTSVSAVAEYKMGSLSNTNSSPSHYPAWTMPMLLSLIVLDIVPRPAAFLIINFSVFGIKFLFWLAFCVNGLFTVDNLTYPSIIIKTCVRTPLSRRITWPGLKCSSVKVCMIRCFYFMV